MSDDSEQNPPTSHGQGSETQDTGESVDRHRSNSPSSENESSDDLDGWRFGVSDVGPEADSDEVDSDQQTGESEDGSEQPIIEPEEVVFEHAALVVVGAALVAGLILTAV